MADFSLLVRTLPFSSFSDSSDALLYTFSFKYSLNLVLWECLFLCGCVVSSFAHSLNLSLSAILLLLLFRLIFGQFCDRFCMRKLWSFKNFKNTFLFHSKILAEARLLFETDISAVVNVITRENSRRTTDLPFDWCGFNQTGKSLSNSTQAMQLNPNQSNRRSAVQWNFHLQSKWVFSGYLIILEEI